MRVLALLAFSILLIWVILTAGARLAVNDAIKASWPEDLGVIGDVPRRYPVRKTTPQATMLVSLVVAVDTQLGPQGEEVTTELMSEELKKELLDFLLAQLQKPDDTIDAPPPGLEHFLRERGLALASITRTINGLGSSVDWGEEVGADRPPSPNLTGHMLVTRLLAAYALLKAHDGDPAAWDSVRAIDALSRPLWRRGDPSCVSAAISSSRLANGVARKLPPPLPAWWHEVEEFDARRALIAADQAKTWSAWHFIETRWRAQGPQGVIFSAYVDATTASLLNHSRQAAEELAALRTCAVDADAMGRRTRVPSWNLLRPYGPPASAVNAQRVRVYDFEREATARVFAIKEHRPLPMTSRCADGSWSYANGVLRFSAPIPLKAPGKPVVPRTLRY